MKILYISDRNDGGIKRHVQTLRRCMPHDIITYAIGEDEPFAGRNGHDVREFVQIRRVIKNFKPDIVHFHIPNVLMACYARMVRSKLICSWHTPTNRKMHWGEWLFLRVLGRRCYFLPVSQATFDGLKKWMPNMEGEVFYNSLMVTHPIGSGRQ